MNSTVKIILKSITWRLLATTVTMLIVFFFTHELSFALGIGIVDVLVKILLYIVHETVWISVRSK